MFDLLYEVYKAYRDQSNDGHLGGPHDRYCEGRYRGAMTMYLMANPQWDRRYVVGMLVTRYVAEVPNATLTPL